MGLGVWLGMQGGGGALKGSSGFNVGVQCRRVEAFCGEKMKMMGSGPPEATLQGIAGLLAGTLSGDRATRESSQSGLEALRTADAGLAVALLAVVQGVQGEADAAAQGVACAGATYLKNMVKAGWEELPDANLGIQLRASLLDVLATCRCEPAVKPLLEAFRIVARHDFCKRRQWPELVDWLVAAMHRSDLMGGSDELSTLRVLKMVHKALLPFQYPQAGFDPKEPPAELEALVGSLVVPCHPVFHSIVAEGPGAGSNPEAREELLHLVTKCLFRAARSYMPRALLDVLGAWTEDLLVLLRQAADLHVSDDAQVVRAKTVKRVLKTLVSLTTLHKKHADAAFGPVAEAAVSILQHGAKRAKEGDAVEDKEEGEEEAHVAANDKIQCAAFELVARMLQGGTGYRLFKDHLGMLVADAVFPRLQMSRTDLTLWEEDEEEYVRLNLWSDLADDAQGGQDLSATESTARLGALSLLKAIAETREASVSMKRVSNKRGKGKAASAKDKFSAGEQVVVKFLAGFPCPGPHVADAKLRQEAVKNYYGVLFGYSAAQPFLSTLPAADQAKIMKDRILPVFDAAKQCIASVEESEAQQWVLLLANACWTVGEFAAPEWNDRVVSAAYGHLMSALGAADACEISWKPVRSSAAGAMKALLEAVCPPADAGPLFACILSALVARGEDGDQYEMGTLLYLFASAIENCTHESVQKHAAEIASTVSTLAYTSLLVWDEEGRSFDVLPACQPAFTCLASLCELFYSDASGNQELATAIGTPVAKLLAPLLGSATVDASLLHEISIILRYLWQTCDVAKGGFIAEGVTAASLALGWSNALRIWDPEEAEHEAFDTLTELVALHRKGTDVLYGGSSIANNAAEFLGLCVETLNAGGQMKALHRGCDVLAAAPWPSPEICGVAARLAGAAAFRLQILMHEGEEAEGNHEVMKALSVTICLCLAHAPEETAASLSASGGGVSDLLDALSAVLEREEGTVDEGEGRAVALGVARYLEAYASSTASPALAQSFMDPQQMAALLCCGLSAAVASVKAADNEEEEMDEGDDSEDGDDEEDEDEEEMDDEEETEDQYLRRMAEVSRAIAEGDYDDEDSDDSGMLEEWATELGALGDAVAERTVLKQLLKGAQWQFSNEARNAVAQFEALPDQQLQSTQ